MIVDIVIPAYNEEQSIGLVVRDARLQAVRHVVVTDNNSKDRTSEVAREAGAVVLFQPRQGYGSACLKGIEWVNSQTEQADILLFMDGDYSDYAEDIPRLVAPIVEGRAELVIGSRALGQREKGSMTPQQVFGNWLATRMIQVLFGVKYTDLGPYRAIRLSSLNQLGLKDPDYGWTVEMQVKAAKAGLKHLEIPVNYRKRIGKSKVAGTLKGTILAGYKIITTILKYA